MHIYYHFCYELRHGNLVTKVPVLPSLLRLQMFLWLPNLPVFYICCGHLNVLEVFFSADISSVCTTAVNGTGALCVL